LAALSAHRERAFRRNADDLVFGNFDSRKRIAMGLGRVPWHQFRHLHSSLLNDLKVPVKIAQEQLGHASVTTTLNIYMHSWTRRTVARSRRSNRRCSQMVPSRLLSSTA
jgi:integrase